MKHDPTLLNTMKRPDILRERARVLSEIRKYEKDELPSDAWLNDPSPDAIYIDNLTYLSEICAVLIRMTSESATK